MKNLVILGAGTAGTIMANKLARVLPRDEWQIAIVDRDETHHYQPGYLFIPFGICSPRDVVKPRRDYLPRGIEVVLSAIDVIEPDQNRVRLANGRLLGYDFLLIATGARPVPAQTEGLAGGDWHKNIFDFYTLEGAAALARHLKHWAGGRLVINIVEMPIKCPVAPLEFAFLADWFFTEAGLRHKVEIEYVTPLSGAFTKPKASELLGDFLNRKNIHLTADFSAGSVDQAGKKIVSWDNREVSYDLLVTVPTNMGDEAIARSGIGDELNFIPTDKHTLRSKVKDNIFVIGDATDLPASKAGSGAHFQADILLANLFDALDRKLDFARMEEVTLGRAFRELNKPEMRRGQGFLLSFLRNLAEHPLPGATRHRLVPFNSQLKNHHPPWPSARSTTSPSTSTPRAS